METRENPKLLPTNKSLNLPKVKDGDVYWCMQTKLNWNKFNN